MTLILFHAGPEFPAYLNDCIRQVRTVSAVPIVVLMEPEHCTTVDASVSGVTVVPLDSIPLDYFTQEYLKTTRLDGEWRGGFWRAASLRFFYIHNYAKQHRLRDIFHIEYDNLVYQDFLPLVPAFQTRAMWCVMDAPTRCIPSFVYWRDADAVFDLLLTLLGAGARGENDMTALATHAHKYPQGVGWLPIVPDGVGAPPEYSAEQGRFGVLFDGAAVGQYIGGVDPRNQAGDTCGFINETTVFRCDRVRVEWKRGADSLYRPYLNDLPLVNLHIHSKDLSRWISNRAA
jgi:hypothetical protein